MSSLSSIASVSTSPSSHPSLAQKPHRHLDRRKRTRRHRHSPEQRWPNALPKPTEALCPIHLGKAVAHTAILHGCTKPVALHLALDDIERVAAQPEHLARQPTVPGDLERANLLARDAVARRVAVHQELKRREPHAVGLGLAQERHGRPAVQMALARELAHAVDGAGVQAARAVGLRLQPDADVLDGAGEGRVGETREGARGVVLRVRKGRVAGGFGVAGLEGTARVVEAAELDRDLATTCERRIANGG
jgi:hypothetical protein